MTRQRWARIRPDRHRGCPPVYHRKWFKVLDRHQEPATTTIEGYVWVETPWKVQSLPAKDLEIDEVIVRARRLVEKVLQQGIQSGEFRAIEHGFGARALPSLLVHSVQVQCWFRKLDPEALSDEEALEGLIDFCLHGVLARPDSRT